MTTLVADGNSRIIRKYKLFNKFFSFSFHRTYHISMLFVCGMWAPLCSMLPNQISNEEKGHSLYSFFGDTISLAVMTHNPRTGTLFFYFARNSSQQRFFLVSFSRLWRKRRSGRFGYKKSSQAVERKSWFEKRERENIRVNGRVHLVYDVHQWNAQTKRPNETAFLRACWVAAKSRGMLRA